MLKSIDLVSYGSAPTIAVDDDAAGADAERIADDELAETTSRSVLAGPQPASDSASTPQTAAPACHRRDMKLHSRSCMAAALGGERVCLACGYFTVRFLHPLATHQ
jgi:hypothetical protein